MNIRCVASGSTGNAYFITDGFTTLLIECGVPFRKIQEFCNFRTSQIGACLITHEHKDHCFCVKEMLKRGIETVATKGTWQALGIDPLHTPYATIIMPKDTMMTFGTLEVMAFDTQHDALQPCGYLIYSKSTGEKLLYLTDSYYCKYRFEGLTDIMIECNYDDQTIFESSDNASLKKRVFRSHLSLENCVEFLKSNDLKNVDCIHLIHLSDRNSYENRMKRKVAEATGKRVVVF